MPGKSKTAPVLVMEKLQFVALALVDIADAIKTARSRRCALSGSLQLFLRNCTSAYFVSQMNVERWLSAKRFFHLHSQPNLLSHGNSSTKPITSAAVPQHPSSIHHFAYQSSWHLEASAGKQQFSVPIGSTAEDTNNGTRWECMLN